MPAVILTIVVLVVILLSLFFNFVPVGLWVTAMASGVNVSVFSLVGMRLRRVRPDRIIHPMIKGTKAGLRLDINQLESHLLSGGRVDSVVDALIAAHRANLELSFERAAAIDLAGRNVFEAVRMSVTPKIIETPWISAVAKDGIEVKVIARVTVRTNIERLVGGADRAVPRAVIDFVGRVHGQLRDAGAGGEGAGPDLDDCRGDGNGRQLGAAVKRVRADGGQALRQRHGG